MNDYTEFIFVLVKINNSKLASFYSAHILSTWCFTMLKRKKIYLEHEIIHILKSICNSQRTGKRNKNSPVLKLFCH